MDICANIREEKVRFNIKVQNIRENRTNKYLDLNYSKHACKEYYIWTIEIYGKTTLQQNRSLTSSLPPNYNAFFKLEQFSIVQVNIKVLFVFSVEFIVEFSIECSDEFRIGFIKYFITSFIIGLSIGFGAIYL